MAANILLVEDNRDDEELTLMTFTESRIAATIHVVRDGVEALDYLFGRGTYANRDASQRPTLILLDIKLPKMTGLEVLEHIKINTLTRTIPVVVLTSSREEADIDRAYELGVNSFVVKPVDFEHFKKAIQQVGSYWQGLNIPPSH